MVEEYPTLEDCEKLCKRGAFHSLDYFMKQEKLKDLPTSNHGRRMVEHIRDSKCYGCEIRKAQKN